MCRSSPAPDLPAFSAAPAVRDCSASSIIVSYAHTPAASAIRNEVHSACHSTGCASTSGNWRGDLRHRRSPPVTVAATAAAPAINTVSQMRLCRRSSGSRQPCSSVVPGAMALLSRYSAAPDQDNTPSGAAPASPRGQDRSRNSARLINSQLDSRQPDRRPATTHGEAGETEQKR